MNIFLNGIAEETNAGNISELVKHKGLNPLTVIVEMNGKIIKRQFWDITEVTDNDRIEILNFVGGG